MGLHLISEGCYLPTYVAPLTLDSIRYVLRLPHVAQSVDGNDQMWLDLDLLNTVELLQNLFIITWYW